MWAPSEKNAQPREIHRHLRRRKESYGEMPEGRHHEKQKRRRNAIFGKKYEKFIPSAIYTARVLEQAPVIVFVMNTKGLNYREDHPKDEYLMELADIQSISAAIQNMCLEATNRNIGSLLDLQRLLCLRRTERMAP